MHIQYANVVRVCSTSTDISDPVHIIPVTVVIEADLAILG